MTGCENILDDQRLVRVEFFPPLVLIIFPTCFSPLKTTPSIYACPGSDTTVTRICRYMPFSLILYPLLLSERSARIPSDSLKSKSVQRHHTMWRATFPEASITL